MEACNMYTIRPFQPTEADYAAIVDIYNAAWPDERPITVAMCRQNDAELPADIVHQRFVVEKAGAIVGAGACYEEHWQHQPGIIHLSFNVHPMYNDQGIEPLVYNKLLDYLSQTAPATTTLATSTREDRLVRVQFLVAQCFQPVMRSPKSALDVTSFDASRFQFVQDKVASRGIQIYTLAELYQLEPDWKQKLCDLRWALIQDVPSVEPPTPFTLADFEQMVLDDPALDPEAWFVAVDKTEPTATGVGPFIGQSNLWINDRTYQRLDTGLTGVIRGYRRRGIATALKLRTIDYAQRHGASTIATSNEENNPMYQINLMLGFQPKPAWVSYRKQLIPSR
jgi:mycothiol synthase